MCVGFGDHTHTLCLFSDVHYISATASPLPDSHVPQWIMGRGCYLPAARRQRRL